jgi:glycosyltransferase involved in cell wall biosynthesis
VLRYRTVGGFDVLQEPFGVVLVKPMMCGTPIAAMRLGDVTEIVDEDVTGCTTGNRAVLPDRPPRHGARPDSSASNGNRALLGGSTVRECVELYTCVIKRMIS